MKNIKTFLLLVIASSSINSFAMTEHAQKFAQNAVKAINYQRIAKIAPTAHFNLAIPSQFKNNQNHLAMPYVAPTHNSNNNVYGKLAAGILAASLATTVAHAEEQNDEDDAEEENDDEKKIIQEVMDFLKKNPKEIDKEIAELQIIKNNCIRDNCPDYENIFENIIIRCKLQNLHAENRSRSNEYWTDNLEYLHRERHILRSTRWRKFNEFDRNNVILTHLLIPFFMANVDAYNLNNLANRSHTNDQKTYYPTTPLESGDYHHAFKIIIDQKPELQQLQLSLRHDDNEIVHANAYAEKSYIVLCQSFYIRPDGYKLFALFHELAHHAFNDCNEQRKQLALLLMQISDKYLQETLIENNLEIIEREISRYKEWRADTHAVQSMQCPHCVQEASMVRSSTSSGYYNPAGYFYGWQFQPRIDELTAQGTICQHHYNNGGKIDLSSCDGSTLADRLKILKK